MFDTSSSVNSFFTTLSASLLFPTILFSKFCLSACKSYDKLVNKFPNAATIYLGKDNDIVLIGEAPANNGWRKSHKL